MDDVSNGGSPLKARVVVADDSSPYLELLRAVLAGSPELELVGTASDGCEAVRVAVESEADIALLDIDMPGLDGFAAAQEIRRLRPGTELFLHTGGMVDDYRRRGRALELSVFDKLQLSRTLELISSHRERRAA